MKIQTLSEQLLFSTVRIESKAGVGTGFLFQANLNWGGSLIFLITNKHVIAGSDVMKFFFTKGKKIEIHEEKKESIVEKAGHFFNSIDIEIPKSMLEPIIGEKYECTLNERDWFVHPNEDIDLAIISLTPTLNELSKNKINIFVRTIPMDWIPPFNLLEECDALENILFIGYPNGMYDAKNLFPIIRRGITATPLYSNYGGKPIFLIDASVFPGSSGSPVFVYDKGSYQNRDGSTNIGDRIFFCGVISSVFFQNEEGEIEFRDIPTKVTPFIKRSEKIDLGVVIKSEKVKELAELYFNHLKKLLQENAKTFGLCQKSSIIK